MNRRLILSALLSILVSTIFPSPSHTTVAQDVTITIKSTPAASGEDLSSGKAPFSGDRPAVDGAILLDTSNSMDGLINQAKKPTLEYCATICQSKEGGQDAPTPRLDL